jgi:hypothetical protein
MLQRMGVTLWLRAGTYLFKYFISITVMTVVGLAGTDALVLTLSC